MQLIATGKWSKDEKRWRMVVALRPAGRKPNGQRIHAPLRAGFDTGDAPRPSGTKRRPKDA
jgi:hypothetical protein